MVREALQSLLNSQAPAVKRKQGKSTGWNQRSRAVVKAHQLWIDSRGGVQEAESLALKDLSISITDMAEIHEQDDLNRRRLIAVLLNRTGSAPTREGTALIDEYASLIKGANNSLHGETSVEYAETYWTSTVGLLEELFLPRELRNEKLERLAGLAEPTQDDLAELKRLVLVPGYLVKFLSLLPGPAWLNCLESSGLLDLPEVQGWWVGHALVKSLGERFPSELLVTLQKLFAKSSKGVQATYSMAWAAHDLGASGNHLLLECLRLYPQAISHLAIDALKAVSHADDFVVAIAVVILDPAVAEDNQVYPDPVLAVLVDGLDGDNYLTRIQLVVEKINQIPSTGREWAMLELERAISVADPRDSYAFSFGLQLVHSLTDLIQRATGFGTFDELKGTINGLSDEVRRRIMPWFVAIFPDVPSTAYTEEIEKGLIERLPSADDILLVDRMIRDLSPGEYLPQLVALYGAPLDSGKLTASLSDGSFERVWIRKHAWSPLMPAEAIANWAGALAILADHYGVPSREQILTKQFSGFRTVESPISAEKLAKLSSEDLLKTVADWTPGPQDWMADRGSLWQAAMAVMAGDVAVWTADPLLVAQGLLQPTYVAGYLYFLADHIEQVSCSPDQLVDAADWAYSDKWRYDSTLDDGYGFEADSRGAQRAAIQLLEKLAEKDIGFGDKLGTVVERLVAQSLIDDFEGADVTGRDSFEQGYNRQSTTAFRVLLWVGAYEFRRSGEVSTRILNQLSAALLFTDTRGVEQRAVLAAHLQLLEGIAPAWLDDHFVALFAGGKGNLLGQGALDVALKWGARSERLLTNLGRQLWNAVTREVPNALNHGLYAMLWQVKGYSVQAVVDRLKPMDQLSTAGETLARMLHGPSQIEPHLLKIATDFWQAALASRTNEPLAGFGWIAMVKPFPDSDLVELLKATLEHTSEPLDASHEVVERLKETTPTAEVLTVLDLMVRRQSHDWDQMVINEGARDVLESANGLVETEPYKRLRSALQERDLI
ncbi:MAG TPA: hypothetical protein VIM31_00475 [Candidatus Microsaccharimonas sp.]